MSDVQKSRQRVFDKALAHLRAQKKLSVGYGGCVRSALSESISETGYQFLSDIQNYLHDDVPDYYFPAEMERSAKELAALYDLKYSAPESIA